MERVLLTPSPKDDPLHKLNKIRKKVTRSCSLSLGIANNIQMHKPLDNAQLQHQRKQSTVPDASLQRAWFASMKNVMEEVDEELKCINPQWPFRFLDIGCCPGGFTSYILGKNPYASGVGISLDVESGGHSYMLEEDLQNRFELVWGDLNCYQLGPHHIGDMSLKPFPPTPSLGQGFDLVLVDGHPLRVPGRNDDIRFFMKGDQLLISQLIIGLSTVSWAGGTIVVKLSKPERVVTSQLMYLFDIMSLSVQTWKPVCMHATRATFYLVAKGFGLGFQRHRLPQILHALRCLWVYVKYADGGKGRRLQDGDLDFIVAPGVLKREYTNRLRELSQHIWLTQEQSMKGWQQARANGF